MRKSKWYYQLYKNYCFNWIPTLIKNKLLWKDKFNTPRCEHCPSFKFEWLWFGFYGVKGDDQYWEQWLWVYKYCDGNIEKAKETWGWVNGDTNESTWIDY